LPLAILLTQFSLSAGAVESSDEASLGEIVVTATKKAQDLQDVPLSITALTAQTLERAGVVTFEDYAAKVPNLTFAPGFGVIDGRQIAIRGIQGLGTTGFYIDDLPIPDTMDPRAVDIDRIEVLRGPQGTLYGARSMGGTIKFITAAPDPTEFSAQVHGLGSKMTDGGLGDQYDGMVNLPLANGTAALRLSGFGGTDSGFINRTFPDPFDPNGLDSVKAGRNDFAGGTLSLLWKATENLTVRPTVMTQSTNLNGWPLSDYSPGTLLQGRSYNIPETAHDKWIFGGISVKYSAPFGDFSSASSWFSREADETEDMSAQVAYFYGYSVKSAIYTTKPGHTFVEELRFTSSFAGPWQFTGGLYLNRDTEDYNQYWNAPGLNAASGGTIGTDLVYAAPGPGSTHEEAAFGELTYQIDPRWSATLGGRESHITVSQYFYETGSFGGDYNGGGQTTAQNFLPKAVLKFAPDTNTDFYALASKGFRPGDGQVAPPPSACGGDYASSGLTVSELSHYAADSVWNYELGTKNRLFNDRLTVDAAVFWIDWKDVQQQALFDCGYSYTVNAGAARSRGGEIEVAALPIDGLQLNAGVGYTDAVITKSSPTLETAVGTPVQQVAPWTVSLSGDYSFPLSEAVKGFVRTDASYTDHSYSANNDRINLRLRSPYTLVNLHAGARMNRLDVSAFIKNISNTHANLGDDESQGVELPGRPRYWTNPPRTVGVEATYRW
jgi:outer membrane receptor protein involved in Fe transport